MNNLKDIEIDILIRKKEALQDEVCKLHAEIERLRYNLNAVLEERADHSEAIKEFAERLKKEIFCMTHINGNVYSDSVVRVLDNLVKKMTENEGKE